MENSLRRSSRRSKKKHPADSARPNYNVGDIVEIVNNAAKTGADSDGIAKQASKGRLISKLTSGTLRHETRWLVGFEDESWPDEDLYETSFGEILRKASNRNSAAPTATGRGHQRGAVAGISARPNRRTSNSNTIAMTRMIATNNDKISPVSPDPNEENGGASRSTPEIALAGGIIATATRRMKRDELSNHTQTTDPPSTGADSASEQPSTLLLGLGADSMTNRKTITDAVGSRKRGQQPVVSAREQRSRRRGRIDDEDVTGVTSLSTVGVRSIPVTSTTNLTKKAKMNHNGDQQVLRIPMLTGTLLLYRGGPHRRAAFVRKV